MALNSTSLGASLKLSNRKVNLILAEVGWIRRDGAGWIVTDQGRANGGEQRRHGETQVPFVVWPQAILKHAVFKRGVAELTGKAKPAAVPAPPPIAAPPPPPPIAPPVVTQTRKLVPSKPPALTLQQAFPATHLAADGHIVRSRAELLIDNWLYFNGIVHAYERMLPISTETVYSDFYIPSGRVYLEYWGMPNDPMYAARMRTKQGIYKAHGFNLIDLDDSDIVSLETSLTQKLLAFGVQI